MASLNQLSSYAVVVSVSGNPRVSLLKSEAAGGHGAEALTCVIYGEIPEAVATIQVLILNREDTLPGGLML